MLSHVVVAVTAGVVTAVATPAVARLSRRIGAYDHPVVVDAATDTIPPSRSSAVSGGRRPRVRRVPTLGGLGMLVGFLAALGVAWAIPGFRPLFTATSEPLALIVGVLVIAAVGVVDDLYDLPPTVKLAGQIVAALGVAVFGIQLVYFWIPGVEVLALSPDLGLPLTIIALVAMINAVNLIDGLDGLAAGVTAIAALAFFLFTVHSQTAGLGDTIPTSSTLVAAIVAGMAAGFLVHNWHPARIFMGDTGAMLLGLLLGAAGVAYVGRTTAPSAEDFTGTVPLVMPALVLAVPFLDTAFAVVRRLITRRPVAVGDRGHLHHLLLRAGHTHRRAVLVLYYWSTVAAFGSVGGAFLPWSRLVPWIIGAVGLGFVLTMLGTRASGDPAAMQVPPSHRGTA
ncbi:MAG: MraY family glycosyltransferase [Nitriliruptoraceae bacterium]